jgi:hypothetical protein
MSARRPRHVGTYREYPALSRLPALVRRQRTLEAKLAPLARLAHTLADVTTDEKATRARIAEALVAAGVPKNRPVTCDGYDVTRRERQGADVYNPATILRRLVAGGVAAELVARVLEDARERESPSVWATVEASPGAKVRRP